MRFKVFISHSMKDQELADEIRRRLSEDDHEVFDATDVLLGQDWAEAISNALKKSDVMVVLLSPESVQSPNVIHEIGFALGSAKYKGRVVPVLVRPTENVPWFLKTIQSVDVSNLSNPKTAADRVARTVQQLERRAG
jgi:hypothetical protein